MSETNYRFAVLHSKKDLLLSDVQIVFPDKVNIALHRPTVKSHRHDR